MITKLSTSPAILSFQRIRNENAPIKAHFCFVITGLIFKGDCFTVNDQNIGDLTCSCTYKNEDLKIYISIDNYDILSPIAEDKAINFINNFVTNTLINNNQICFDNVNIVLEYKYKDGIYYSFQDSNNATFYRMSDDEPIIDHNEILRLMILQASYSTTQQYNIELLYHAIQISNLTSRYVTIYQILYTLCLNNKNKPSQKEVDQFIRTCCDIATVPFYSLQDTIYGLNIKYNQTTHITVIRNAIAHYSQLSYTEYQKLECDIWTYTRILINVTVRKINHLP